MSSAIKKFFRFLSIYGLIRTIYKVYGRKRPLGSLVLKRSKNADVALIGCGQFGFATIGYFLTDRMIGRFISCYDINKDASRQFSAAFRADTVEDYDQILLDNRVRFVYIASNHCSHTEYAIRALASDKIVYVEKPISVSWEQLSALYIATKNGGADKRIYAGYNRPFSSAVQLLKRHISDVNSPISLSCFVSGHIIDDTHWYRDPSEGTRICGNAGHWIDLFVNFLAMRKVSATKFRIIYCAAKSDEPDDNFSLSLTTDLGDIFSLILTARTEPFEGINETINFQQSDVISKIDDFRSITIWKGSKILKKRFWPKDVGHRNAILQPFQMQVGREWSEVINSSIIMLAVKDLLYSGATERIIDLAEELTKLENYRELESSKE